jgi:hypothetical protein
MNAINPYKSISLTNDSDVKSHKNDDSTYHKPQGILAMISFSYPCKLFEIEMEAKAHL